jgi:uncharacterized protein YbjQ (UPF0145 family)
VILTNIEYIPGKDIIEHYGIVTGSTVRSTNVGVAFLSGLKNIIGGELTGYTDLLNEARDQALKRLTDHAMAKGANAVINIRFATSDLPSGAMEIYVYGTAVRV